MTRCLASLAILLAASCSAPAAPGSVRPTAGQVTPSPKHEGATVPRYLLNEQVTQLTIAATICKPGWTKTIRPPSSYTQRIERQKLPAGADSKAYVVDHLIALEIGGAPREPRNLMLQTNEASKAKNRDENAYHRAVCAGRMTLEAARDDMYRNWKPT